MSKEFTIYRVVQCGRRAYRCAGCSQTIPQGTQHVYGFGVFDGNHMQLRVCVPCGLESRDTRAALSQAMARKGE